MGLWKRTEHLLRSRSEVCIGEVTLMVTAIAARESIADTVEIGRCPTEVSVRAGVRNGTACIEASSAREQGRERRPGAA
jgi:hypothetical protein